MGDLLKSAIDIMLRNQSGTGAYPASPAFDTYRYCWFRDGSFIAYALDLVGETASAASFHDWAARAINARASIVERAVAMKAAGKRIGPSDTLHTRYTLAGEDVLDADWPNHQLDGFGTWLWAVEQHRRISGRSHPAEWSRAGDLIAGYLSALWGSPCYDLWEEFPEQVHTYTLGAIHAGLREWSAWDGLDRAPTLRAIEGFIRNKVSNNGHLLKFEGSTEVDASLIGLSTPYGVLPVDEPLMRSTVSRIESELSNGGGLHRYPHDTFYGGGEWVVLTAWMGWHHAEAGEVDKARTALQWVEAQADQHGALPEQVPVSLIAPDAYPVWRARWGEIAKPLLWSHAMYIILRTTLAERAGAD